MIVGILTTYIDATVVRLQLFSQFPASVGLLNPSNKSAARGISIPVSGDGVTGDAFYPFPQ
ncbi:MAG: hypothetical protein CMJ77_04280 [Planctomycetaceae bacterium]|nr:hypothetical protein [Planctomycetaceae bacterium]